MNKALLKNISKSISSGLTPLRSNGEFWINGSIPWLKTEQLGEKYIYDTSEKISTHALEETSIKLNPINTLSVAMYGEGKTRGNVSIIKRKMATNQACCNLVIDEEKADYEFVYYYLKSKYAKLRSLSSGVRKNLNSEDIKNFEILLPKNVNNQKKIVKILSVIDSKIELNNKINSELEKLSETIYHYWFVQFDFPNDERKPYKSSGGKVVLGEGGKREVPEGWKTKKISDLLTVITGKKDANFATSNGKYNFFTCGEEILKCNTFEFEGKSVLVAGNGNFNVKHYDGKFNAYQRTYILTPKDDKYYTVIYLAVKDRISSLVKGSRGSIVKFITKGDLENIEIALPVERDADLFSTLNTITKKIEINVEENLKLIDLRDWLLPMLMNGQVKVEI